MAAEYVIRNKWALGDTVCLSAAIRDAVLTHPKLRLSVEGHYKAYWRNCPYVVPLDSKRNPPVLDFEYCKGIEQAKKGTRIHFAAWFHREFHRLIGLEVPVLKPRGEIWLSDEERRKRHVDGRYWLLIAGGKLDITAKWWSYRSYQKVATLLGERGIRVVQGGARMANHVQPKLTGCINMVDQTEDIRDLFSLIYHAEGVICGVTGPMHIAAAFEKPCVVIAGGREDPWWEAYVNNYKAFGPKCEPVRMPHRFLHTIGMLDCCKKACWKAKTVPLSADDLSSPAKLDKLCAKPNRQGDMPIPECMTLITPEHVVGAVMSYYENEELPPVGELPNNLNVSDIPSGPMEPYYAPPLTSATNDLPALRERYGPREYVPPPAGEDPAYKLLDHPVLGGKVTICILSWGDNFKLLHSSLDMILRTVPKSRRDIRVLLNQPCEQSRLYVDGLIGSGDVTKMYADHGRADDPKARKKYPAMRQAFHDPDCPLTTKYLLWFDDDSRPVHKKWLTTLAELIINNHQTGGRLYGRKLYHDLSAYAKQGNRPDQWFRQANWWRDVPLRLRSTQRLGPNGSCIDFVAGWFWAVAVEAIREADIPDARLWHNGGDITIGAQIHQIGRKVVEFNSDKTFVFTPKKEDGGRRGWSEAFPWADAATKERHRAGS